MINWKELHPHVLNQFPAMQDWEFDELKESISKGYDDSFPIVVYKGDGDLIEGIIDGANRHRACIELGVIPNIKEFYGSYEEAMAKIMRTNVRRNLNAGQKAAVVLDMTHIVDKLIDEAAINRDSFSSLTASSQTMNTNKSIANLAGVGRETVNYTKKVKEFAPDLFEKVKSGEMSAKAAYTHVQDDIAKGDAQLSMQRTAKSLLKAAIQAAVDDAKDELYAEALRLVESEGKTASLKLKITLL